MTTTHPDLSAGNAEGALVGDPTELESWFSEARRLFDEAEERYEAGRVLSALSSLAAVPPLHRMLIDRFSGLLHTTDPAELDDLTETEDAPGMYL